jgi:hypothetical protein
MYVLLFIRVKFSINKRVEHKSFEKLYISVSSFIITQKHMLVAERVIIFFVGAGGDKIERCFRNRFLFLFFLLYYYSYGFVLLRGIIKLRYHLGYFCISVFTGTNAICREWKKNYFLAILEISKSVFILLRII